jgi:hypothetical protein
MHCVRKLQLAQKFNIKSVRYAHLHNELEVCWFFKHCPSPNTIVNISANTCILCTEEDAVYDCVNITYHARLTMFSVMALDGRMFYLTSAATIRSLLDLLLKDIKTRINTWENEWNRNEIISGWISRPFPLVRATTEVFKRFIAVWKGQENRNV